nr:MAG TPA: hypothetical protein [Caudoviricetes sp.]
MHSDMQVKFYLIAGKPLELFYYNVAMKYAQA